MTYPSLPKASNPENRFTDKLRIWSKTACLLLSVAIVSLGVVSMVEAVQDPPGCTDNAVVFTLGKNKNTIANGDTVTYTITVGNGGTPACTASNIAIQGFCPDATGASTVPATINVVNPVPNPLPVPTATFTYGTFTCTVNVNSGVTIAQARDTLSGILNDLANANDPLSRANTVSVNLVAPNMSVTKDCQFTNASTVNVSGVVTNTGTDALTGLQCQDDAGGTLTLSGTSIAVGGNVTYTGSFSTNTSPHTDTVSCTATGVTSQIAVGPKTASATCAFIPPPPPPNQIPTLSGWVFMLLGVFLALIGASTMLRRKPIA